MCISAISTYFLKKDLNLIASRLKVGTAAEKESSQKITQAVISVFFFLLLLIPSIDHHFEWSNAPAYLSLAADGFVAIGLMIIFLVFKENSYTSVIIEVNEGQRALLMLLFTPLALGSFWGLLAFLPCWL